MELFKEDSAPAAKRPRMEPQNDKEIIQDQRQIIENLKARIRQLEEERLKFKSFLPVPELPNETWIKIMSYLSTYDVLINVAQVSKKFHQLSQDPHLIRKIHVDYESWPENQKEEYRKGFLRVLKRSVSITFLSFQFGFKGKLRSLAFLNRWCFLFQIFSKSLKSVPANKPKFAIDLRSPEELEQEIKNELDSEA